MSNSDQKKKKLKSLNKGPCRLFPDIGKEAKDLLNKGYIKDDVFSISKSSSIGVVQSTTVVKHGRLSTSNIVASYKNATVDVKFDSKSHLSATLGFRRNFSPSTRTIFTLKLPDYSSSDVQLKFQYLHENAALASSFVLNRSPTVAISAAIGDPRITFGVEAEYKTSRSFTKYDAGIHVENHKCNASIILSNKVDLLKASYMHQFDQPMKVAVAAEISRRFSTKENTLIVGGSCEVDRRTTLKVKLDNHGKLNTLLLQRFRQKSYLSVSGEINMKGLDKTPRIGLAVFLIS